MLLSQVYRVWQVVKTQTIIFNNPVNVLRICASSWSLAKVMTTAVVFVTLSHPRVSVIANSRKPQSSIPSTTYVRSIVARIGAKAMKA